MVCLTPSSHYRVLLNSFLDFFAETTFKPFAYVQKHLGFTIKANAFVHMSTCDMCKAKNPWSLILAVPVSLSDAKWQLPSSEVAQVFA